MKESGKKPAGILVVDDEKSARFLLQCQLEQWGYAPLFAADGLEALECLRSHPVDLVLSDQVMPRMDGIGLLREVRSLYGELPFVMVTAHGSIDQAVKSIKEGADDYIQKPLNMEELRSTIERCLIYRRLSRENEKLKDYLRGLYSFQNIVTTSPAMIRALQLAEKVARSPKTTVAIYGESGTGKEVLARAIHFAGESMENPFVAINCAGVPSSLLETELFGHVKGAFTGADKDRAGKFEIAHGGTILLDEIGDMPLEIQAKLLRVLQEQTFERLGSNTPLQADLRVIIATHKNLAEMVQQGRFREDLYHRVTTFPIFLPPLRERREDIPNLADYFLNQFRSQLGKPVPGLSQRALDLLLEYRWPGNIRELKNCLERAAILTDGELIKPSHLIISHGALDRRMPAGDSGKIRFQVELKPEECSLQAIIDRVLETALEKCGQNKSKAAELLRIDRKIFYRRNR